MITTPTRNRVALYLTYGLFDGVAAFKKASLRIYLHYIFLQFLL